MSTTDTVTTLKALKNEIESKSALFLDALNSLGGHNAACTICKRPNFSCREAKVLSRLIKDSYEVYSVVANSCVAEMTKAVNINSDEIARVSREISSIQKYVLERVSEFNRRLSAN